MTTIEPHSRHPLHATAAAIEQAFKGISASKPDANLRPNTLRPIIIYGLSDAQAAVQATLEEGGQQLALLSPAGIAHSLGPQWFNELVRRAQARTDDVQITGILDCGRYEGHVMLALQSSCSNVYFTGDAEAADKLMQIAAKSSAVLHRSFAEILDLKGQGDQLTACRAWLNPSFNATKSATSA